MAARRYIPDTTLHNSNVRGSNSFTYILQAPINWTHSYVL
jgi:hypothetical protein